jgi:hypothetical protein
MTEVANIPSSEILSSCAVRSTQWTFIHSLEEPYEERKRPSMGLRRPKACLKPGPMRSGDRDEIQLCHRHLLLSY